MGIAVNTEQGWVSPDGDYQTPLSDMDRKGLAVDEFGGGQALDAIGLVLADVTVHEVGVNIGSSFSF